MDEKKAYTIMWPNKTTGSVDHWDASAQQFVGFLRSMNLLEKVWAEMLSSSQTNKDYWSNGGQDA
jgi:hypothetical protein